MIQLIVPRNHIVVFSKLAKVLLLLVFSGTCGDVVIDKMLSFLVGQALQRKPKEPMESSKHICICDPQIVTMQTDSQYFIVVSIVGKKDTRKRKNKDRQMHNFVCLNREIDT